MTGSLTDPVGLVTGRRHGSRPIKGDVGMYRFKVYRDRAGEYRWRLVSSNGRTVADSGEGYGSRSAARDAAQRVKDNAGSAPIEDEF